MNELVKLQERVSSLVSQGIGAMDTLKAESGLLSPYYQSVSPHLSRALGEIDSAFGLDCSHLFVRDIHDPGRVWISTSSVKYTVFRRERFPAESPFLADLRTGRAGEEIPLERRKYGGDRVWELFWETMTVGTYARPWSLVGFPLHPGGTDTAPGDPDTLVGFLLLIGPRGWHARLSPGPRDQLPPLVAQFALTAQTVRIISRLDTLTAWASPEFISDMATAGKLHGVLAPLQRLELKLGVSERTLHGSSHREILSGFEAMRAEIFEVQRCVRDFLDTRALPGAGQGHGAIARAQYTSPQRIIREVIHCLRELADRTHKSFVLRDGDMPGLPITAADFELIITNLLHNAVKYGAPDTKIKVTCGRHAREVFFDVTSYGICIRPAEKDRIFDPGYRTAEASRIEYTAAGLGLFTSRRAAARWGGHLFLRISEPDRKTDREADGDPTKSEFCRTTFRLILRC